MTQVLAISDAHKSFGDTAALNGTELALNPGERLALLGPNGAGKTTLIRAIAGRVKLTQGTISLFGQSLLGDTSKDEARRRLGIVPQEIALYPMLTARENLSAWGILHGVLGRKLTDRIEWAIQWTGLTDRSTEPIKRFSGGMKRRLNIACGVLHRPEVILLDEPTVGVDPQSRQRIWEMLDELHADGAALLLTTHQLDEAQKVCDRIVIIDKGKVIAEGTFPELVAKTIGPSRQAIFVLESDVPISLHEMGFEVDGRTLHRCVDNLASELPAILTQIEKAGGRVEDLRIEAPSLQAVFIHLTGRELRE